MIALLNFDTLPRCSDNHDSTSPTCFIMLSFAVSTVTQSFMMTTIDATFLIASATC